MKDNKWLRLLAYVTGLVNQDRRYPGRPRIESQNEALVVQMAQENSGWGGNDRIVGALPNLGHRLSDKTVANVLSRHGIEPARKRNQNTTWKEFIESHIAVLAGIDFFTVTVRTWRGLMTYLDDVLRTVLHSLGEPTGRLGRDHPAPDEAWMQQMACNATNENWGPLERRRYALHDRDTKFCASFRSTLAAGGIRPIRLPPRSPNLSAHAERWVRSVKQESLSKLILFGRLRCDAFWLSSSHIFTRSGITKEKGTSCCSRAKR